METYLGSPELRLKHWFELSFRLAGQHVAKKNLMSLTVKGLPENNLPIDPDNAENCCGGTLRGY